MDASTLNGLAGSIADVTNLSDRIREAMGKMSPAELARAADVTPATVTFWLDGTTKTIKGGNAVLLERATGYRPNWPMSGKGPTRVESAQLDDPSPVYAGKRSGARSIPIVGTARMGEKGYYEEISSIPGAGDGHIDMATTDPNAYGLRVRGNSMAPAIRDG